MMVFHVGAENLQPLRGYPAPKEPPSPGEAPEEWMGRD